MDDYEREWTTTVGDDNRETRLRYGLTKERGSPREFLVQLEYKHPENGWMPVARFDHDRGGEAYRDLTVNGLHLDIHAPDGTQKRKLTGFPSVSEDAAIPFAERYLKKHYQTLVTEYEQCL